MLDSDVYRILGVAPDADAESVKAAYRKLALENHPERGEHDDAARARFEEAARAYAAWNAKHGGKPAPAGTPGGPAGESSSLEDVFGAFGDLFGQFFGNTGAPGRGADLRQTLRISQLDARCGCTRTVEVTRRRACASCRGSGARDGVTTSCTTCQGKGTVQQTQGFFVVEATCPTCKRRGAVARAVCGACDHGFTSRVETLAVEVPPNVDAGQILRFPGKGDEGTSGEAGHLYLTLEVATTNVLERLGDDTKIEVPIDVRRYWLGGRIEIDTLEGKARIPVPRRPRDGTTIKLAGRGHPKLQAAGAPFRGEIVRGDQLVVLRVSPEIPAAAKRAAWMVGAVVAIGIMLRLLA